MKFKSAKFVFSVLFLFLAVTVGAVTYYLYYYKEDLNKRLPMTVAMDVDKQDPEGIAYKFWLMFMQPYTESDASSWKKLTDVRFNEFNLLAGDENEFTVTVNFWAKLEKKKWSTHNNWGKVEEDGLVKDIQWSLRIKKTGENEYTLLRIEEVPKIIAGLAPVKDMYQKNAGIHVPDSNNRYVIENGLLKVTYDNGDNWKVVPTSLEELFAGDYSGSKQELIKESYVISPEKTAFVIGEKVADTDDYPSVNFKILQSSDQGQKWRKVDITNSPGVRARFLGFTSEQNGYLIISYDRTMGFEANTIYKTNDGGDSWKQVGSVDDTNRHITDGGFINENIGFISFGSILEDDGSERPFLYRTTNGGKDWVEVKIPIPSEYKGVFTVAQVPILDGSQGVLLVNQGPNGDYQGGKVLARFTTVDGGATWFFSNLVDPKDNLGN